MPDALPRRRQRQRRFCSGTSERLTLQGAGKAAPLVQKRQKPAPKLDFTSNSPQNQPSRKPSRHHHRIADCSENPPTASANAALSPHVTLMPWIAQVPAEHERISGAWRPTDHPRSSHSGPGTCPSQTASMPGHPPLPATSMAAGCTMLLWTMARRGPRPLATTHSR